MTEQPEQHPNDPRAAHVTLPGGYWDEAGHLNRTALLRPLTGREEELLADHVGRLPTPALVTHVLSRCVLRIGRHVSVTTELVRGLLVADRDYLLLELRRVTFGERVQAILTCVACGERMDLDFATNEVPVEERVPPAEPITVELSAAADGGTVQLRLPTGADQEFLATLDTKDHEHLARALLDRCVLGQPELNAVARAEIEAELERRAPRVDLDMDIHCPACGATFVQYFNFAALIMDELAVRRGQLYRDVHALASHYHWSESDILALTTRNRRLYIGMLQAAGLTAGAARGVS